MLYLLDANVLITAQNTYYPLDRVPEFWEWLIDRATRGDLKMPLEVFEEIKSSKEKCAPMDQLHAWASIEDHKLALILDDDVESALVNKVLRIGYAPDLNDTEIEKVGRDPFLIAYALVDKDDRCVVTAEASKPSTTRANRRVPDACDLLGVARCNPFEINQRLGFKTSWRSR